MKRFLRLTQEATFGTYASGGSAIWIRLDTPKAFQVMTAPQFWEIMSGSGFAVGALSGSEVTGLAANLSIPMFYSQWSFLVHGAVNRINGAQTAPWTTGEAIGDLASFTADFGWSNFDGTIRRKRFLGCKIAAHTISGQNGGDNSPVRGQFSLIASTPQGNSFDSSSDPNSTVFPEPADTLFPTDPILFQHLRAGLTIGTSRTNFDSFGWSIQGKVKPYFDESRFANAIRIGGRRSTMSAHLRLKASPDDRAAYEQAAKKSFTYVLTNGTNTATMTFNGQNRLDGHEEDFPLDEEIYYSLSATNLLDTTAGSDVVASYA